MEARGRSSMPERFRYLTKEAPEKPVRWPWLIEATVPDSLNSQPYLFSLADRIGFAAVRNYISELFFWTLLVCMFGFANLIKKRDCISSALPPAAVLAVVGEPWVRVIAIISYLTLDIFHHSKSLVYVKEGEN